MARKLLGTLAAVALLLVLAAPASSSPVPRDPARRLRFSEPLQVESYHPVGRALGNGERQPSGEPSIKVDSRGVVYISGVTSVGVASPIWVSQNGGRSFERLSTPLGFREDGPYGAEGDIAIDRQDRMYFVDTAIPTLAFSRWSAAPGVRGQNPEWDFTYPHTLGVLPGFDDRPWIAYGATPGGVESLWLYVNHVTHVAVYRSTNQGLTWTESTSTFPGQRFFTGHVAAPRDDGETAYLFGNCGDDRSLCARFTHDGGATPWTEVEVAEVDAGRQIAPFMVSSAVDAAGNVYGVWGEADPDDDSDNEDSDDGCDVYYAASYDGGATWAPKVRVSDGSGCSTFPWVTAGDRGRIGIAYYRTDVEQHQDEVPDDAAWFLRVAVVGERPPRHRIVDAVADPNPIHFGPLGREHWDYIQVATGPDGRVHVAYVEDVTSGPDGPAGTGLGLTNGMKSKDTMYVQQTGGPRLVARSARPRSR